jgi:biotin operon repressor
VRFHTAVRDLPLPLATKATGFALAGMMNRAGVAWASVPALALAAGCSERSVQRAVRQLEAAGLLAIEPRAGGPSRYGVTQLCQGWGDTVSPGGRHGVAGGVTQTPAGGDTVSPGTVKTSEDLSRTRRARANGPASESDEEFVARILRERGVQ